MNDINTLVEFTIDNLNIKKEYVWFNSFDYKSEYKPYLTIDNVDIYFFDNSLSFDPSSRDLFYPSYIVYAISGSHYVLFLQSSIDFIKFFDYTIGYIGYDELTRY